jgi:hypothetical protein
LYSHPALALLSMSLLASACGDSPGTTTTDATDTSTSDSNGDGDGDGDGDGEPVPDMPSEPDPNEMIPPPDVEGCHAIYAQDLLPTFELTMQPVVWELLQDEWNNGQANEEMGIDPNPYHPLTEFRYGDIVITDAAIRLRGNPEFWEPLPDDKMQFQIGFHTNDPEGHFLGLKRLCFDAATYNRHMLRDRLSLAIMRDVGIPAPCANNARLVINGEYYGIFSNIEKLDEVFLARNFDDPSGDLWKRASWELQTNEDTGTTTRLNVLKNASSIEGLDAYLELESAMRVYAAEAVLPDSDGSWAGGLNYYVYDDPSIGKFVLLPWDLDNTFERFDDPEGGDYPANPDPVVWEKGATWGRPWYDIAIGEPQWFDTYIGLIDEIVHTGYEPELLHGRIDEWTAQIQDAVFEDVNKPYSNDTYLDKVEVLHEFVDARYAFLDQWLVCWQSGGVADADGYCVMP